MRRITRQLPERMMLTTESFPAKAFQLWQISTDHPYILGDLTVDFDGLPVANPASAHGHMARRSRRRWRHRS